MPTNVVPIDSYIGKALPKAFLYGDHVSFSRKRMVGVGATESTGMVFPAETTSSTNLCGGNGGEVMAGR